MNIDDLYKKGVSFEEFVNRDSGTYREKTLEILEKINFSKEEQRKIESINKAIKVLICAEMWCPDCMINVPVIEKIRQISENISISIVGKEGNEQFFEEYAPEGNIRIPTFVFFDSDYNVLGSIIEHPKKIKEILSDNNQPKRIVAMRKYRKGEYARETLNDILEVIL